MSSVKLLRALTAMLEGKKVAYVLPTKRAANDAFMDAHGVLCALNEWVRCDTKDRLLMGVPTATSGTLEFVWCDVESVQHSTMVITDDVEAPTPS